MEGFLTIITIVSGVLELILFFKIWGMTNNVKKLLKIAILSNKVTENALDYAEPFSIDDLREEAQINDQPKAIFHNILVHVEKSKRADDVYHVSIGKKYLCLAHKSELTFLDNAEVDANAKAEENAEA